MATETERRRRAYRHGRAAEWLCAALLVLKGYRIVARGVRLPVGEIDIVARRAGVLACVEVKRRKTLRGAVEAVTARQRRRIGRAAEGFVARRPDLAGLAIRFDVMLVAGGWRPRHIEDAWRPA